MSSGFCIIPRMKKYWKRIAIVLLVLVLGGTAYRKSNTPPKDMTSAEVARKTLESEVSANGKVAAHKAVDLKFNLPGKLAWMGVKEGDRVKRYQAVAAMDKRLLQKDLVTSLASYKGTFLDFRTTHEDTYKDQVITELIQRELDKSQFGLDKAVLAVEVKDIVAKEATLVSPIEGSVVATNELITGINLSATDLEKKTIRVVDMGTIYFNAQVDEVDYGKVKLGQEARVEIDAYPEQSCRGEVTKIASEGRESSGGVVTIPIEITLHDCELKLVPGLSGEAKLVISKTEEALVLPKKYVVREKGEDYVFVEGKSYAKREKRKVKVGASTASEVQIVEGVGAGERVLYLP